MPYKRIGDYGVIGDCATLALIGRDGAEHWKVLQPLVDEVIRVWHQPDDGIREARIGPCHCVHSKPLCCVAFGREIKLEEHHGFPGEVGRCTNLLGLPGEQYEPHFQEITGNFPQAYSPIGYATTVRLYLDARRGRAAAEPIAWTRKLALLLGPHLPADRGLRA